MTPEQRLLDRYDHARRAKAEFIDLRPGDMAQIPEDGAPSPGVIVWMLGAAIAVICIVAVAAFAAPPPPPSGPGYDICTTKGC